MNAVDHSSEFSLMLLNPRGRPHMHHGGAERSAGLRERQVTPSVPDVAHADGTVNESCPFRYSVGQRAARKSEGFSIVCYGGDQREAVALCSRP
jgi:hypothetical protein